jgi:multiphosphoryl transfer protein
MVGIVIVSHSAPLASAVVSLAQQVTPNPVAIAIAAGIDDPENPFGTDALSIQNAIESVYDESGVIVLMDLGSAVLNAEMALEFLTEEQRSNVKLCEAPLVEGAIAAVIEASFNAPLAKVVEAARNSLIGKISQLGLDNLEEIPQQSPNNDRQKLANNSNFSTENNTKIQLIVTNKQGLHLRPAAQVVTTANRFISEITLQNLTTQSQIISAKSVNQVMLLNVREGHLLEITAQGEDAILALETLQELIKNQLDQSTVISIETLPETSSSATLRGIPASPGIALAQIISYQPSIPEISTETSDNPSLEWEKLQQALKTAIKELEYLIKQNSGEAASIFQAHLLYLQDKTLINPTYSLIFSQNLSAATAWKTVIEDLINSYQSLSDRYLQARAMDIKDVGMRVFQLLTGIKTQSVILSQEGILVTTDLKVDIGSLQLKTPKN